VLLDMVYLQQDAFDDVDAAMSRERQLESFELVKSLVDADFDFPDRDAARDFFTRLTGLYKNWNYAAPDSPEFERYRSEITQLADQHRVGAQGEAAGESAETEAPA
jgi:V/A-type H+-transporting ATPase subunit A